MPKPKPNPSPSPSTTILLTYYFPNLLFILSFPPLLSFLVPNESQKIANLTFLLLLLFILKYIKSFSDRQFFSDYLKYSKLVILGISFSTGIPNGILCSAILLSKKKNFPSVAILILYLFLFFPFFYFSCARDNAYISKLIS